jgi:hypothetical protein
MSLISSEHGDAIGAAIKHHLRGRHRISLSHLGALSGLTQRQLVAALKERTLAHWVRKRGWSLTDSKSLGLQALEAFPFAVPFLVRN